APAWSLRPRRAASLRSSCSWLVPPCLSRIRRQIAGESEPASGLGQFGRRRPRTPRLQDVADADHGALDLLALDDAHLAPVQLPEFLPLVADLVGVPGSGEAVGGPAGAGVEQ